MKFEELIAAVQNEPVFATGHLLTAGASRGDVERQLSRWIRSRKLLQLRRGFYALAEPWRKIDPHPFLVANRLAAPSYISLQSALEFHGLIPEAVPNVTSVTTGRPESIATPLGTFIFRHIRKSSFSDFSSVDLGGNQHAFIASPEKALLDLVHLTARSDHPAWLAELRLQNLDALNDEQLTRIAAASRSPKLIRAARLILELKQSEVYETL